MRSSQRNLGLQPEDMPEESSEEETRMSDDQEVLGSAEPVRDNSEVSEDVNLNESDVSGSDQSEDDELTATAEPESYLVSMTPYFPLFKFIIKR